MAYTTLKALAAKTPGSKDLDVVIRHCFILGISRTNCTVYDRYGSK